MEIQTLSAVNGEDEFLMEVFAFLRRHEQF
jgi:hypothetical protein